MISEIEKHIPKGNENAVTAADLQRLTGADIRTITAIIQRRRRQGVPICAARSGRPGYFIAATAEDLRDYCGRLKHEEKELRKTRQACEKLIKTFGEETEE